MIPISRTGRPATTIAIMIRHPLAFCPRLLSLGNILHPTDNVSKIVSSKPEGTTSLSIYRYLSSSNLKTTINYRLISCAPPASSCPAIISGAVVIGPSATFDGTNYQVAKQRQQAPRAATARDCDPGWLACIYPEDLFFDSKPYRHLDSPTLPTIGPGEWWFDYTRHVVYFHDDPTGHTVETSVLNNAFGGPANNVTIRYLTVEKVADMYPVGAIGETQTSHSLTQETNWTVENCDVRLNHGFGVRVGYRIKILSNYIHDNGQVGIGGGIGWRATPSTQSANSGILIQGNIITHNDYAHFDPHKQRHQFEPPAFSLCVATQSNEVRGFISMTIVKMSCDKTPLLRIDAERWQEIGDGISTFRTTSVERCLNIRYNSSYQIAVRVSAEWRCTVTY